MDPLLIENTQYCNKTDIVIYSKITSIDFIK